LHPCLPRANLPALPKAQIDPMKLKIRRSNLKRARKVGFRSRSKTPGGRKIIKRKRARSGRFRVG